MVSSQLVVVAALLIFAPNTAKSSEMSYVMEPFEVRNDSWLDTWSKDNYNVSLTEESYVGGYALRVDYAAQEGTSPILTLGVIQATRPHICVGATDVSFWYQLEASASLNLRLTLLDDSECTDPDCASPLALEQWTTLQLLEETEEWKELRVSLKDLTQSNVSSSGNNELDLNRLRGFLIELEPTQGSAGMLKVDQLACIGGGDLFGAALFASNDFEQTVATGGWVAEYFESGISRNESEVIMQNGTLEIVYLVQHVESWGGYIAYSYLAPGPAYYNLTSATHLSVNYQVKEAVTNPERVHFRFILADASDCIESCDSNFLNHERYYSFHYILGDEENVESQVSLPLLGSTTSSTPFWMTGWSGSIGNEEFDPHVFKGYTLEFNIDSLGDPLSIASGAITFSDIAAVLTPENVDDGLLPDEGDESSTCVEEPGIEFDGSSPVFTRKEFLGARCCEVCEADPNCLYALSTGRDCFLASHLEQGTLGFDFAPIRGDTVSKSEFLTAFWINSVEKRGDFCDLCDCDEDTRSIDCRGKELLMVPKTFNKMFTPRSLDLRENPNLLFLGSGSLSEIAGGLQELWLPEGMIHLGANSLTNLPELRAVRLEGQEEKSFPSIKGGNIISGATGFFGSVCCGRGNHFDLAFPEGGFTFCEPTHVNGDHPPGIDSIYMPFMEYRDATVSQVLRQSSSFMSEAAESVEKCAEYCHVSQDCRYFSYDARRPIAEHLCLLLEDTGVGLETVCCKADHYADEEMTIPGWTSGRPPLTRHVDDNARVLVEPQALVLSPDNDYESYFELSLGSTPLRGSVRVIPFLVKDNGLNVSIWPSQVALYDGNSTVKVNIKVSHVEPGAPPMSLMIKNIIQSCDDAFTSYTPGESAAVDVDVSTPPRTVHEDDGDTLSCVATVLGFMTTWLVLVTTAIVHKKKEKNAIRFAQIEFLRLLLAGSFLVSIGAILVGAPTTDVNCLAAIWFLNIGYTLELVPMIVKVAAINRMMDAAQHMRRITLPRSNLFGAVAFIMGFVLVFLTLWSFLDPPQVESGMATTVSDENYTTVTISHYCSGYHSVWNFIALGWNSVLLLSASVLAFQTRKIKRQDFNESQTLAFTIYSHFVLFLLQVSVFFLSDHVQEKTLNRLRSILFSLDTIATVLVYFIPKLMINCAAGGTVSGSIPFQLDRWSIPQPEVRPF